MFVRHVVGSMKYVNDHSPAKLREHHGNLKKKKKHESLWRTRLQLSYSKSIFGHSCNSSEVWMSSAKCNSFVEEISFGKAPWEKLLREQTSSPQKTRTYAGVYTQICMGPVTDQPAILDGCICACTSAVQSHRREGRQTFEDGPLSCRPLSTHAHSQSISLNIIGFLSPTVKKYRCICIQI